MDNPTDEKYISIEYEVWKNKYLPMEEENNRLIEEIKNNQVRIVIEQRGTRFWDIGYTELTAEGWRLDHIDLHKLALRLEDSLLTSYAHFRWIKSFLNKEQAEAKEKQLTDLLREIRSTEKRIQKIPGIVRWLFNIK